jgi:NADH-quinone oxidoreductase subunit G
VIAENDLFRRLPAPEAEALWGSARHVVVIDHLTTPTVERADLALPAATFAEVSGTLVSGEGRGQRFVQVLEPRGDIQATWRWCAGLIAARDGAPAPWRTLDEILRAIAAELPVFRRVPAIAPGSDYRVQGRRIPREPHRYSGRTAMTADVDVHEPAPPADVDSPLSFSMEGATGAPPVLEPRVWYPGWNSVQALTKLRMEILGPRDGEDSGIRLLTVGEADGGHYYAPPLPSGRSEGEWLAVPAYHTFGSEELSILSRGIADLAPKPYLGVSPADMERLDLSEGQEVGLALEQGAYGLPVRARPHLATGCVAVPVGLPGLEGVEVPGSARLLVTGITYPELE